MKHLTFLAILLISINYLSCKEHQNSYLNSKKINSKNLIESNIILKSLPKKLVYGTDKSLFFINDNSLISVNPKNGILTNIYNCNALNANKILFEHYNIDTLLYDSQIKKYKISTIKPSIDLVNFDCIDSNNIILLVTLNYPDIIIEEGVDTKINVEMKYKRMLLRLNTLANKTIYNPIDLFSNSKLSTGDMPETSFFVYNNYIIIGRSCFAQEGTKYSIASCYNLSTLTFLKELPIYITKSKKTERKKNGIEILHNYSNLKSENNNFVENDNSIYNLETNKVEINLTNYLKDNFYINSFININQNTWLVEISTDDGTDLYEINNKKLNLIDSNSPKTIWLKHPLKNYFYTLTSDSSNYAINTYQY